MVWFYELHYREKIHSNMLCYTQKWVIHWHFNFWVFTFWNLWPNITCRVALTKVFLTQIFLHFGQSYFYSRQDCNKRLANWTAINNTLTLNGFTRNTKHGFNSWKWSNLAWNSSSSLTIYFGILPHVVCKCLFAKQTGSHSDMGKWQNAFDSMCLWKIVIFFWEEN